MAEVAQRCSFTVGDVVDNRFRVCRVLGEGSFGKVYAVCDERGNTLALKLLKLWEVPSDIRDSLIARFDMEYETGRIESRYLVRSLSHGFTLGNPYIVMEYCPHGDLLSHPGMSQSEYSRVATHVLYGLKALHSRGKVHRDLKPENVLVKGTGEYALTDFGISGDRNKRMTERNILGKPKQIFGTYAYMPPEQLKPNKDATVLPTTDIFSFGVMMYQLLTGGLPFGSLESEKDLIRYMRRGKSGDWDRDVLRRTRDGQEWIPLLDGCMNPDYQQRIQNADEALPLIPQSDVSAASMIPDEYADFQTKIVNGVLLRVMQGDDYGRVYKLDSMLRGDRNILSMGRADQWTRNDIALTEATSCYISRKHCTLELDYISGSWVIRDGQWDRDNTGGWKLSTNGTYVNSREVPASGLPFRPGDIISIGDTKLRAEAY